jgi:signal transduction histidine kinase
VGGPTPFGSTVVNLRLYVLPARRFYSGQVKDIGGAPTGLAYPRLVPSSLLPPEDPTQSGSNRRTVRDWFVDITVFLASILFGVLLFFDAYSSAVDHVSDAAVWLDWGLGAIACLSLWWRRRWPIAVGLLTAVLSAFSGASAAASVIGMFTAVVHRRATLALTVALANVVSAAIFPLYRPQKMEWWLSVVIATAAIAVVTAWGMFVRARRQLVWTLRERAERAETEQRLLADQARLAERTRIAREMHDVLAHRISLMALHAGGLALRPDLPTDQIRDTAELLRSTAQQALEELRGVIGVLRDESATGLTNERPAPPQPTLRDIPRLVDETRRAGAKIDFVMTVPSGVAPPDSLGRDAYRIVQEALTNVAKHARGTVTSVQVSGAPGDGLHVDVRNRMPLPGTVSTLPGSGSGLLGLHERVALAGGTLVHGPNSAGEFVVDARLTWL